MEEKKFEGLTLWDKVQTTDPTHTKSLNFGRKITAIDAYQQIKNFTREFGTCGIGWGYNCEVANSPQEVCVIKVELWLKDGASFCEFGTCEWKSQGGKLDSDAPKKATTDGLTKAFSRLGFNADVFMGKFEDNKYVEQVGAEKTRTNQLEENWKTVKPDMVKGRFAQCGNQEDLVKMIDNLENHFGPLLALKKGDFCKTELIKPLLSARCIELDINPVDLIGA